LLVYALQWKFATRLYTVLETALTQILRFFLLGEFLVFSSRRSC